MTGREWSVTNVKVCIGGAIRLLVREQQFRMGPGRAISWMHCDFYPKALSGPIDEAFENLGALSSVFDDPLGTGTLVILDSELSSSRAKMQPAPSRFVLSATLGTPKVLATRSSEKNAQ